MENLEIEIKNENGIEWGTLKLPFELKEFEKIRNENLPDEFKKQKFNEEIKSNLDKLFKDKVLTCLVETLLKIEDYNVAAELFRKYYMPILKRNQVFILECCMGVKWKGKQDGIETWWKYWQDRFYWEPMWTEIKYKYNFKRFEGEGNEK